MLKLFFAAGVLIFLFALVFWNVSLSLIPAFSDYSLNAPTQFIFGVFFLFPFFLIGILGAVLYLRREDND